MWNFDKVAEEVRQRGGMMPTTSFEGYRANVDFNPMGELTEAQVEASWDWYVTEVNRMLPDFAEWIPATSSIIVPIDKIHELDDFFSKCSWDELLNDVFEKYIKNCESIIGSDEE